MQLNEKYFNWNYIFQKDAQIGNASFNFSKEKEFAEIETFLARNVRHQFSSKHHSFEENDSWLGVNKRAGGEAN